MLKINQESIFQAHIIELDQLTQKKWKITKCTKNNGRIQKSARPAQYEFLMINLMMSFKIFIRVFPFVLLD